MATSKSWRGGGGGPSVSAVVLEEELNINDRNKRRTTLLSVANGKCARRKPSDRESRHVSDRSSVLNRFMVSIM
jgi:hypothetical protein